MLTVGGGRENVDVYFVLSAAPGDSVILTPLNDDGTAAGLAERVGRADLPASVEAAESNDGGPRPRWVWRDTATAYAPLLAVGVRVERCHDLRLSHAILRASSLTAETALARASVSQWDAAAPLQAPGAAGGAGAGARAGAGAWEHTALFDLSAPQPGDDETLASARAGAGETEFPGSEPGDARPGEARPGEFRPAEARPGETRPGDARPAETGTRTTATTTVTRTISANEADDLAEFRSQLDAISASPDPNRLRLLLAAESAGALIAAEMSHAGLPWREDVHDELLTELLGPRVAAGLRPERLERLAERIRVETGAAQLNPDSPADVLKALRNAGLTALTTRSWELEKLEHPAIAPLLEYKKLSRLLSANGWSWMEAWVTDGRFVPDYVPGGVVSGRWATRGGGALQLPKQVRRAVTADEGWMLVVADAAQLEPRILAGISGDAAMAAAGRGTDLYAGIVASGAVSTRAEAKVAMLGAMYGATTGESGRLLPRLARAYPTALAFVENAARAGERGDVVTSRLGRSAPRPGEEWWEAQARAAEGAANDAELSRARQQARDWGRFTRNFVVQASAADWALCWMADLRRTLASFAPLAVPGRAAPPFDREPHLVFFLHDEVIVHTPAERADAVAAALRASAAVATRLLFGSFPIDVPLDVSIVASYADAA
jgi:DNA polymerase-1